MTTPAPSPLFRVHLRRMPGDGNCMFHSMAAALDTDAASLRHLVVTELKNNAKTQSIEGMTLHQWCDALGEERRMNADQYVNNMSQNGTWGDEFEIAVISRVIHQDQLVVYTWSRNGVDRLRLKNRSPIEGQAGKKTIHLLFSGNHYDLIQPVEVENQREVESFADAGGFRTVVPCKWESNPRVPSAVPAPQTRTVKAPPPPPPTTPASLSRYSNSRAARSMPPIARHRPYWPSRYFKR